MPGTEMHARAPPEGTNDDPTAPPAKDIDHGHGLKEPADDEEKAAPGFRAIKVPDEEDLSDGINDPSNMDVDHFLKRVGCGDPRLKAPGPDDEAWPPLPEGVQEVRGSYFRDPDFAVGVGGAQADGDEAPKTYVDLLTEVMERLGLAVRRGAGARAARVVGNSLLAATGIGAFYVAKKTRRLQPGEVAFYVDKNLKPHYVRGGWSLESNPFHGSFTKYDTDTDYIEFQGVVHVVRVRPGHYVRGVRNGHPILLKSGARNEVGVHVVVDPSFSLVGRMGAPGPGSAVVRSDADHVDANPLHIIMVPPEKVVAISIDRRPYVLFPGRHVLESSTLLVHAQQGYSLTQAFSVNSLLHSYPVYPGQLGCVKLEDEACFVDRPMHLWFYSPHAELMPVRPLEEEVVSFASLTRLVLDDYRRALIRNASGSLVTLSPGVHVCRRPVIHLASFSSEWYQARMPISAVTADPLDVVLTATMSYRVVDVASFYKAGDPERTHNDVREMAKSTMSEIVRSMRFEETLRQYGGPDTGRELHLEEKGGVAVERKLEGEDIDEVAPVELIRSQWQHASREHTSRFANFLRTTFGIELDLDTWQFCDFDLKDQRHQEELTKAV